MSVKIVSLSTEKENKVNSVSATFLVEGNLTPLKVNEADRPDIYRKVNEIISNNTLNLIDASDELFETMSPEVTVKKQIKSSYFLSSSVTIRNGKIFFGDNRIEKTLEDHLFSLLEDEAPKDEKQWRSYVKFLDNLFQNANEEIREQLFRWMDYENKKGDGFAITEDGCIVGYKGCDGTVLNPISKFSGFAIVNGQEMNGQIPNKVGSIVQMPRSAVQHDPSVGCSQGLHVGTRHYATQWAPILLLVKVNPRDVVSVPFECSSQKIRVCEYTVLEVTDKSSAHNKFYGDFSSDNSEADMYDYLGEEILVKQYGVTQVGTLTDVYSEEDELVIVLDNTLKFTVDESLEYTFDFEDPEEYVLSLEVAEELMEDEAEIILTYDGKEFVGSITSVFDKVGSKPGVIIVNEDEEVKHIKLNRIEAWEETVFPIDDDDDDDIDYDSFIGSDVVVSYDGNEVEGTVTSIYDVPGKEVGVIVNTTTEGIKHIKVNRIDFIEKILEDPCADCEDSCEGCEDGCLVEMSQYSEILKINPGSKVSITAIEEKESPHLTGAFLKTSTGIVTEVNKCEQIIKIYIDKDNSEEIGFEDIHFIVCL